MATVSSDGHLTDMENCLITGGAGFIGSGLCQSLLGAGNNVTVLDNFSSGRIAEIRRILKSAKSGQARLIRGDCKDPVILSHALRGVKTVFHLAANPEVRSSHVNSNICFGENVLATHVLLEQLKNSDVQNIVFASSSTVYGEARLIPTPEEYGPLEPISIYGASKLASEALITAYSYLHEKKAVILRFANIIGPTNRHGVISDFLLQIRKHPDRLRILGNGHQRKSYLYIDDCISAILLAVRSIGKQISVFNVGSEDQIDVFKIANVLIEEAKLSNVDINVSDGIGDGRGWKGDVRNMLLDVRKLRREGWKPLHSSEGAVRLTIRSTLSNGFKYAVPSIASPQ